MSIYSGTEKAGSRGPSTPLNLKVRVRPIAPRENLVGFASVTVNGCFAVEGIRVCSGPKGLFLNMPSMQDSNGRWHDVCKPVTADFRKQLTDAVAEGYGAAIEKMQATLDAARGAQKKPSAIGALRESAGRVQAQPAGPASNREDPAL
jgi:stage V sporulation protein G